MTDAPAYGLWSLLIINSVIFVIFAFQLYETPNKARLAFL